LKTFHNPPKSVGDADFATKNNFADAKEVVVVDLVLSVYQRGLPELGSTPAHARV
jgi:hypothetical protein